LVLHSPEASLRRSLFSRNWHSGSLKETFQIKCRSHFDSFSHLSENFFSHCYFLYFPRKKTICWFW
jgi:hypothetical protein